MIRYGAEVCHSGARRVPRNLSRHRQDEESFLASLGMTFSIPDSWKAVWLLLSDCQRLHVLYDGARKLRSTQFRRAFHHPFEVIRDPLLSNGALDPCFDQFAH